MADVSTLAGATLLTLVVLAFYAGWGRQSTGPRQKQTLRLQIREDGNVTQEPEPRPLLPLYLPLLAAGLIALVLLVV